MILVDTGPLVALCDRRDSLHRTAMRDLKRLGAADLGTCDAVVTEACFHLMRPAQRRRLRAVLDQCEIASLPVSADVAFRGEVFDWLIKYGEHEPDWADGCL